MYLLRGLAYIISYNTGRRNCVGTNVSQSVYYTVIIMYLEEQKCPNAAEETKQNKTRCVSIEATGDQ